MTITNIDDLLKQHDSKDLLRLITCGNVDDGKSTLIGRLLLDVGAIYDDQIQALQSESEKQGKAGGRIDTALLLDGLEDERRQGITIDVAYRYFTTRNRKFIIADTPGHEQFTRNMATGASTADLAVILVDAGKGLSTQTRRHAFIASLLGVRHVVLAVNKMDLVGYSQTVFDRICDDFNLFTRDLSRFDVCPIPLSAIEGDNITQPSDRTEWYTGPTLLQQLESVQPPSDDQTAPFRFPVQWVNRPDAGFRGFSGTVASGTLRVGNQVLVLPSQQSARVDSILTFDGTHDEASVSNSITVTLDREIDITRGDMLVSAESPPTVSRHADATMVWMSEQPLVPGKVYWCKHTTRRTACEIKAIDYRTDVNTLKQLSVSTLKLNEIGRCRIELHDPIMLDPYSVNRETGSFILVDRMTHETVAAGMLCQGSSDPSTSGHWNRSSDIVNRQPVRSRLSEGDRRAGYRTKPMTVLISGLSGSGKTSVALALEELLFHAGKICIRLDGQELRNGISRDLGFTAEERSENLRRAGEIARLINDAGQICLAAFVAPSAWVRKKVRDLIGHDRFFHVHLSTPADVCRQRDTTGQYAAADKGLIHNFPGVSFDYTSPNDADLTFDTQTMTADEVAQAVFQVISELD